MIAIARVDEKMMRSIFLMCSVLMAFGSFPARGAVDVIQAKIPISETFALDLRIPKSWQVALIDMGGGLDSASLEITAENSPGFVLNIQVMRLSIMAMQGLTPPDIKKQLETELANQEQTDPSRGLLLEVKGSGGAGYYLRTAGAISIAGSDPRTFARGMLKSGDIFVGFDLNLVGVDETLLNAAIDVARSAKLSNQAKR